MFPSFFFLSRCQSPHDVLVKRKKYVFVTLVCNILVTNASSVSTIRNNFVRTKGKSSVKMCCVLTYADRQTSNEMELRRIKKFREACYHQNTLSA